MAAYYAIKPDAAEVSQQVSFGTSAHRGSSLKASFNEHYILATAQAVCEYRSSQNISGPLEWIPKDYRRLRASNRRGSPGRGADSGAVDPCPRKRRGHRRVEDRGGKRLVRSPAVGHRRSPHKIYAKSFKGESHLKQIQTEARTIVSEAFAAAGV